MSEEAPSQHVEIGSLEQNREASVAADTDEAVPQPGAANDPTRRRVKVTAGSGGISAKEYKLLGYTDNSIRSYKYPWVLFLPMNLFEQFQRMANIYFLIIVIISFVPALSPQTPITSLAPLVLVLALQALKDGLEDLKRHRSDDADNNSPATVIRDGVEMHIKRMEVRVGDVLVITQDPNSDSDGAYVAADCVLLATKSTEALSDSGDDANSKGICYINTKQLDGETNLKIFQAKPETAAAYKKTSDFGDFECELDCEGPGHANAGELYKFSGNLTWRSHDRMPLTKDQLLLRGHSMEQTYKAWALVVNTGMQTKIQMNLKGEKPYKMSSMEQMLNKQVLVVFLMLGLCVITCGTGLGIWLTMHGDDSWYIFVGSVNGVEPTFDSKDKFLGVGVFDPDDAPVAGIYGLFTYIVVLSTFVPISLYVTIEMIKFVTGLLIDWDMNMFSEDLAHSLGGIERDENGVWDGNSIASMEEYKMGFAKCKSSKLVEQLGQVQYILSDKTGTLTRNKMELCKCAIVFEKNPDDIANAQALHDSQNTDEPFYDCSHEFGKGVTEIESVKARMQNPPMILEAPEVPTDTFKHQHEVNKHVGVTFEFYDSYLNCTTVNNEMVSPFLADAKNPKKAQAVKDYFLALALCNTVVPEDKNKKDEQGHVIERFVKYNAASPDDGALVKAAMNMGYTLKSRSALEDEKDRVVLEVTDYVDGRKVHHDMEFIIHATLDADSVRKRMTVVASGVFSNGEHKNMVICKGADNIVLDRCAASYDIDDAPSQEGNPPHLKNFKDDIFAARPDSAAVALDKGYIRDCQESSKKFAEQGLRCMGVAQIEISDDRLKAFLEGWHDSKRDGDTAAQEALENRLEYNLRPLGITAIEDKLQKNVGRCLKRLGKSGIRTWVLTGDKVDTAINIGYACNLLGEQDHLFIMQAKHENGQEVTVTELTAQLDQFIKDFENGYSVDSSGDRVEFDVCSLVIEGEALSKFGIGATEKLALSWSDQQKEDYHKMQEKVITFAGKMAGVVCCRVSPKQKGDMTKLVKEHLQKVCLGVGDGANDVEMILQGDVGVGVQGVEGSQAVNNSDFAITEFQHLENLLLVHGRWTYARIATSVCYFFYKNIAFTMCIFWFSCFCAFSGQLYFEAWSAASYNVFFTSLPVLVFGLTNQDLSQEVARKCPALYQVGQDEELFNYKVFIWWVTEAMYASVIMFFFAYAALAEGQVVADGRDYEHWTISTATYAACVIAMTLRISFETSYYTWITHLTYWGSIVVYFVYQLITNCVGVLGLFSLIPGYGYQYWVIIHLFQSGAFYLYLFLVPVAVNLPAYLYRSAQALHFPNLNDKCRNSEYWKELVLAGLMDPDMADMTEEERMALHKKDQGPDEEPGKDRQLRRKGTGVVAALSQVPADSMGGGDNVALWSGRKNLTGKAVMRRAIYRVMMQSFLEDEVSKQLALKDELKKKARKQLGESNQSLLEDKEGAPGEVINS